MAKMIVVSKANPVHGNEIEPVVIEVSNKLPQFARSEDVAAWFLGDAQLIENALHQSLPGGTYDRLLGLFVQRKASQLVVAYPELERTKPATVPLPDHDEISAVITRIATGTTTVQDAATIQALADELLKLQAVSHAA